MILSIFNFSGWGLAEWAFAVFAVICVLAISGLLISIIVDSINSKPCIACEEGTTERNENGKPFCGDCAQIEEAEKTEKIVHCPHCKSKMSKKIVEGITIDKCPKCHGVWLDSDELDKIAESIDDNSDSGHGSGLATGLMLGMAMNR